MDLPNTTPSPEIEATVIQVDVNDADVTEVAIAVDEAAYLRGWRDAMRSVLTAMRRGGSWRRDEYFDGWMDAVTAQPVDPIRLATARSRYARGYADGAREHDLAHRGGCDAE